MSEVLSQNEIDSLLSALSTGELDVDQMQASDEKKVKDYDFKRPAKFSKEHPAGTIRQALLTRSADFLSFCIIANVWQDCNHQLLK